MESLALVHLGPSTPEYLRDCVHQIRLWSRPETARIFLILDPSHRTEEGLPTLFWNTLANTYKVDLRFTDELEPTQQHLAFRSKYKGDTAFRRGYWQHVRERFFYMEELMQKEGLDHMIAMEYDVLLYTPIQFLGPLLQRYAKERLCYVMDNDTRGHPGILFIGSQEAIHNLNATFVKLVDSNFEDMQTFAIFKIKNPDYVATLPVITPKRNASNPERRSLNGGKASSGATYLSDGFDELNVVFDSLCVGQWIGGIDPRNTEGRKIVGYYNESALYSMRELKIQWAKYKELWLPILDGAPLMTIHMHSKALKCFLSDRSELPQPDYDVAAVQATLEPNKGT